MNATRLKIEYVAKEGSRLSGEDAQAYGERIEWVARQSGRPFQGVTPADLVADGRNVESPLNGYFEWDDKEAGRSHRANQARYLMRNIQIVEMDNGESTTRQRVNLRVESPDDGEPENLYIAIEVVDADDKLRAQYLALGIEELRRWVRKWERYEELDYQVGLVRQAIG